MGSVSSRARFFSFRRRLLAAAVIAAALALTGCQGYSVSGYWLRPRVKQSQARHQTLLQQLFYSH